MEFAEETALFLNGSPIVSNLDDQVLTLIIQSRAQIQAEEGWVPLEDWTVADTGRLPSRFRAELREFVEQERNGGKPPELRAKKAPRSGAKPSED
jgi:hypothetical protein